MLASAHSPPAHRLNMQLRNGKRKLDAYRPTFDPHLDIATVVFSHVQCVKTRHSLARVSKLWRDASKTAAAYPLRFDFDAFPDMASWTRSIVIIDMWTTTKLCLCPTRESLDFLVKLRTRMRLRCSPGECKTAEVGAREQP